MTNLTTAARLAFLILAWVSISAARAADYVRVAYDDAGAAEAEPHLAGGSDWRFENPGTTAASLRTAAFGECVEFRYAGLNPKAAYKAKLRFFSDGPRRERIKAGGMVALDSVVLENGAVTEREFEIPSAAYADGKLILTVERVSGPNAAVSEIEILSTDPAALRAMPLPEPPLPVLTPRPAAELDLSGTWKFTASAPAGFEKAAAHDAWSDIQVPGEWVMQGFKVEPNAAAAYFRTFELSSKPAGRRFKLRFSAVYSLCRAWLNGVEIGGHEGGFVPFEFDVTDAIKSGRNTLAVSVQSESLADKLSCGSQYASHPLGGITRKVQLFSVADIHLSDLKIETAFDKGFRNATLTAKMAIRNESSRVSSGAAKLAAVPIAASKAVEAAPVTIEWAGSAPRRNKNDDGRYRRQKSIEMGQRASESIQNGRRSEGIRGQFRNRRGNFRLSPD